MCIYKETNQNKLPMICPYNIKQQRCNSPNMKFSFDPNFKVRGILGPSHDPNEQISNKSVLTNTSHASPANASRHKYCDCQTEQLRNDPHCVCLLMKATQKPANITLALQFVKQQLLFCNIKEQ